MLAEVNARVSVLLVVLGSVASEAGYRQSACQFSTTSVAQLSVVLTQPVLPGNTLVVLIQENDDFGPVGVTVDDVLATPFVEATSMLISLRGLSTWVGSPTIAATDVVSVHLSPTTPAAIFVFEYDGIDPTPSQFSADASIGAVAEPGTLVMVGSSVVISHALSNGAVASVAPPLVSRQTCWSNVAAEGFFPDGGVLTPLYATTPSRVWLAQAVAFSLRSDAGTPSDVGGGADAGVSAPDAGADFDAGLALDAGAAAPDAGSTTSSGDAGVMADGGTRLVRADYLVGCSCDAEPGSAGAVAAWLFVLSWLRSRSRRAT